MNAAAVPVMMSMLAGPAPGVETVGSIYSAAGSGAPMLAAPHTVAFGHQNHHHHTAVPAPSPSISGAAAAAAASSPAFPSPQALGVGSRPTVLRSAGGGLSRAESTGSDVDTSTEFVQVEEEEGFFAVSSSLLVEKRVKESSKWGKEENWRLVSMIVKSGDDLRQEQVEGGCTTAVFFYLSFLSGNCVHWR